MKKVINQGNEQIAKLQKDCEVCCTDTLFDNQKELFILKRFLEKVTNCTSESSIVDILIRPEHFYKINCEVVMKAGVLYGESLLRVLLQNTCLGHNVTESQMIKTFRKVQGDAAFTFFERFTEMGDSYQSYTLTKGLLMSQVLNSEKTFQVMEKVGFHKKELYSIFKKNMIQMCA